ncbi:MAG: ATP-binding protein [Verrucomicrobiales bacterium]|nr:ATP-binding protein [Verrucomicrobiales bacterium]
MALAFANRQQELRELDAAAARGGLTVLYGRRRVGKTRLILEWLNSRQGLYSQAIEGAPSLQLDQLWSDLRGPLHSELTPRSWGELLELLNLHARGRVLCLDEFPYLVASDPSLPSLLQRWLDHRRGGELTLLLCGSSTRMMNAVFLNRSAPLFGRAGKLLHIRPMSYGAFCAACGQDAAEAETFERFALVGGVPRYWEFVKPGQSVVDLAQELFFGFAPFLEQEPMRILRDEGIVGINAVSVLEAVGRGAEKPSEIAARLGTAQSNLSRLLQQLLDANLVERELPFGESLRTTKRLRYRIADPALRFWFRVYSPHRSRWPHYAAAEKRRLIHEHAATVFEDCWRRHHPEAGRFWEADIELDLVRTERDTHGAEHVVVSEVKWRPLSATERQRIERGLPERWARCAVKAKAKQVRFEVIDASNLAELASRE